MQRQTKKKRRPLVFASVACLLIIVAVGLLVFSQNNFSTLGQTTADAKGNQPNIETEEIPSSIEQVKVFKETYKTSTTTYEIEYPETTDESFNETIQHFINTEKEQFLALAKDNEDVSKDDTNKFTINVTPFEYKQRFYSFTFKANTALAAKKSTEHVATFIFDNESAQLVSFEDILNNNLRYLETFNQFAFDQLSADTSLQDSLLNEKSLKKAVTYDWEHYPEVAIEDNYLIVYFQPGEVTAESQGVVTIKGDMNYLHSILAEPFQSELTEGAKTLPLVVDNRKRVALTFDDGPHKSVTEEILNILDEFDAKATFFMLGKNVQAYPEIAKEVHNRGHVIGNHTWTHPVLTKLPISEVQKEYTQTEEMIFNTIGEHTTIFRPPYGATNDDIKALIPTRSVNWSLDTLDWKHRNAQTLLSIVKSSIHNNAVILMHDIHQPTADGLRAVLQYLQSEGYEFTTVDEVLSYADFHM